MDGMTETFLQLGYGGIVEGAIGFGTFLARRLNQRRSELLVKSYANDEDRREGLIQATTLESVVLSLSDLTKEYLRQKGERAHTWVEKNYS